MTDCKSCNIPAPIGMGDGTGHGRPPSYLEDQTVALDILGITDTDQMRPPKDLKDRIVDISPHGGLGANATCLYTYTVLLTSEVYETEDVTSTLYPLEFDDSLAPSAVAPSVGWSTQPMDSMAVSMVAPAVYRRPAVRYRTYDNAEPEALGVAMLTPSVQRIQQIIPAYHEYAGEPESMAVAMLPPAVFRKKVADYFDYTIPEETLAIAMLAPTVTRTNT